MAAWSAVLRKDGQYHTFLGRVFDALEDRQRDYNFLLGGVEAYPGTPDLQFVNQAPVWIPGKELTRMIRQEDFQWVWGALLAFPPQISREQALACPCICGAPEYPDLGSWYIRNHFLETGAEFMIFAEDSTFTEFLTRDRELLELFCRHESQARVAQCL